ncbi:MAG: hypothetical protein IRZ33_10115 [Alicyclobacillaceae bacterium]|nr:hypothetical protein [Alicyclobacillaceae bacterium]
MRRLWQHRGRQVYLREAGTDGVEEALRRAGRAAGEGGVQSALPALQDKGFSEAEWRCVWAQAGLSARERQYVESWLQGVGGAELAALAGVSAESVKTWRKRAFSKIRRALADDQPAAPPPRPSPAGTRANRR